jgi:hypothetical protein
VVINAIVDALAPFGARHRNAGNALDDLAGADGSARGKSSQIALAVKSQ